MQSYQEKEHKERLQSFYTVPTIMLRGWVDELSAFMRLTAVPEDADILNSKLRRFGKTVFFEGDALDSLKSYC